MLMKSTLLESDSGLQNVAQNVLDSASDVSKLPAVNQRNEG